MRTLTTPFPQGRATADAQIVRAAVLTCSRNQMCARSSLRRLNNLRQPSWHSHHQVRVRNREYCRRKERNAEDNTPLRTKLSKGSVHGSLLAGPSFDRHMRKTQILGQG